jgi:hypothetical protein
MATENPPEISGIMSDFPLMGISRCHVYWSVSSIKNQSASPPGFVLQQFGIPFGGVLVVKKNMCCLNKQKAHTLVLSGFMAYIYTLVNKRSDKNSRKTIVFSRLVMCKMAISQ